MNEEKDLQLRRIDFSSGSFEAGGKKYIIESLLSGERFAEFQTCQRELLYGMSISQAVAKHGTLYQLLNQQRFADCAVMVNDLVQGMARLQDKEPTVFKICALFCNAEDEDRKVWDSEMMARKVDDFKKSGIAYDDFFQLAFDLVPGYIELWKRLTQHISGIGGDLLAAMMG